MANHCLVGVFGERHRCWKIDCQPKKAWNRTPTYWYSGTLVSHSITRIGFVASGKFWLVVGLILRHVQGPHQWNTVYISKAWHWIWGCGGFTSLIRGPGGYFPALPSDVGLSRTRYLGSKKSSWPLSGAASELPSGFKSVCFARGRTPGKK